MATAAVDLAHLARYTGGDAALNAEILRLFDSQASEMVARLQSIIDARDAKSWKEVTHTLKGAARGIGAFAMADAASPTVVGYDIHRIDNPLGPHARVLALGQSESISDPDAWAVLKAARRSA